MLTMLFGLCGVHGLVQAATGTATFYSDRFEGRSTASSETFDQDRLTAAHHSLPFGTQVKVTNLHNGRAVVVRINDRMHRNTPTLIDVSKRAARELGFLRDGRASVMLEIIR
jgi:rare lipoprotein A